METLTQLYVYISCSLVNVILHSSGLFLLLRSYKSKHKTIQHLCIINLSLTELVRNIVGLLGDIYFLVDFFTKDKSFKIAGDYMWYVSFTCMHYLFIFAMFLIIADRLMAALLPRFRYKSVCVVYRQKLIFAAWCVCIFVCLPAVSAVFFIYSRKKLCEMKIYKTIRAYIPSLLNMTLFVFATVSYIMMFSKFRCRQRLPLKMSPFQSFLNFIRSSKFFMSILLMSSFVVFTLVPYTIGTIPYISEVRWTINVYEYVNISTILSDTVDAIVYMLLYPPVQMSFLRKIQSHNTVDGAKYILLMTTKKRRSGKRGQVRGGPSAIERETKV